MAFLLIIILIAIAVAAIYAYGRIEQHQQRISSKEYKGLSGEKRTISYIESAASEDMILHDVRITDKYGNNAQIDIVVLDKTGIYVVEVKNLAENAKIYLTNSKNCKLYYRRKYQPAQQEMMYNPIWQNRTHITRLSTYLNLPSDYFVNIVAIAGGEYVDHETQHDVTITYSHYISGVLRNEMSRRRYKLDNASLVNIRRMLKPEMQAQIERAAELQRQREIRETELQKQREEKQAERQKRFDNFKLKIKTYVKKQAEAVKNVFTTKSK